MTLLARQQRPTIRPEIIEGIRAAASGPDLHIYLQDAIRLEHATIPAYLSALYSIPPGANREVASIILSVVRQEMLHMTIAANVLNAIGGAPTINAPGFIPVYPGPLPMSVDDGLIVGLFPVSDQAINVFMRVEKPENPEDFPDAPLALRGASAMAPSPEFNTIGQFYDAIKAKIEDLGDKIFVDPPRRQIVDPDWFPADQLFAVTNVASAKKAIDVIKVQGEGTSENPFDGGGAPAHYYRFEEILKGRRLVPDPTVPERYSWSGAPVPFDRSKVLSLVPNSKLTMYPPGSAAREAVSQANYSYTALLNALHQTFNGAPDKLRRAIALMYEVKLIVQERVVVHTTPDGNYVAAPSFEFDPTAAL